MAETKTKFAALNTATGSYRFGTVTVPAGTVVEVPADLEKKVSPDGPLKVYGTREEAAALVAKVQALAVAKGAPKK